MATPTFPKINFSQIKKRVSPIEWGRTWKMRVHTHAPLERNLHAWAHGKDDTKTLPSKKNDTCRLPLKKDLHAWLQCSMGYTIIWKNINTWGEQHTQSVENGILRFGFSVFPILLISSTSCPFGGILVAAPTRPRFWVTQNSTCDPRSKVWP